MLILEGKNIKKQFGERTLFHIDNIKIYHRDKIGIVGKNGSGKTSLIKILLGIDNEYEGHITRYGKLAYIPQLEKESLSTLSGGESTKEMINKAFSQNADLIIADEPTSNLDTDNVKYLEKRLLKYSGALIVISHDRELLSKVCNKIIEIDLGKLTTYKGGYDTYLEQRKANKNKEMDDYIQYVKEKKRLQDSVIVTNHRAERIKKAPSRMGISEARLHRRKASERRSKVEANTKAIQTRLDQLEVKEKPFQSKEVKIIVPDHLKLSAKIIVEGKKIYKCYGSKQIFEGADLAIENGKKTLLYGKNGSGKTTLLNMIIENGESIIHCKKLKIGYYEQSLNNLKNDLTILENVMASTSRTEKEVRSILGNFLFRKEDVYKKVGVISGGERVKTSFAKVFLSDINFLILDEPTNYLDIQTREAIELAIKSYEGPILFVSHDRQFASKITDQVIYIKNKKLLEFRGNYNEFIRNIQAIKKDKGSKRSNRKINDNHEAMLLVLQNRLSNVISRLSEPSQRGNKELLENEYEEILKAMKAIRNSNLK